MTMMSESTMILRRRCVAVDDDGIRIDVTDDDDRMTTTVGFSIPDPFSQSRDSGLGDF